MVAIAQKSRRGRVRNTMQRVGRVASMNATCPIAAMWPGSAARMIRNGFRAVPPSRSVWPAHPGAWLVCLWPVTKDENTGHRFARAASFFFRSSFLAFPRASAAADHLREGEQWSGCRVPTAEDIISPDVARVGSGQLGVIIRCAASSTHIDGIDIGPHSRPCEAPRRLCSPGWLGM